MRPVAVVPSWIRTALVLSLLLTGCSGSSDDDDDTSPPPETPTPGEETPTPAEETPTPAEETPTPANETPTPAEETPTPAEETPTPSEETPTPTSPPASDADQDGSPDLEDCDDADPDIHPGAAEICDGIDSDCDGEDAPNPGSARLWHVPGDFTSIQAALEAACDGDTIEVGTGTWRENLDFGGKALTVVGTGGPEGTVLDGGENGSPVVTLETGSLYGFTITGGAALKGGGIHVRGGGPVTLEDLTIEDNSASEGGGGVHIEQAAGVRLANALIRANTSELEPGGGVRIMDGAEVTLEEVRLEDNIARYGGGLAVHDNDGGSVRLVDTTFSRNLVEFDGGGLHFNRSGALDLERVTCLDNHAGVEGGGIHAVAASGVWSDVTAIGNRADDGTGGGVFASNMGASSFDWHGGWLQGNGSRSESAVYFHCAGTCYLANLEARGNVSDEGRAALTVYNKTAMDNLIIAGNVGRGLNLLPQDPEQPMSLTNATVVGNTGDGILARPYFAGQLRLTNVIVAHNSGKGILDDSSSWNPVLAYNDVFGNAGGDYAGLTDPTGTDGNLSVTPAFVSFTAGGDPLAWDLHLAPASTLVDVGNPSLLDPDGSRSDIGAYGGERASSWPAD